MDSSWAGVTLAEVEQMEPETADMVRRVVVSVEQFTSFRGFTWCPLGSLHKRLRDFDNGVTFQRAVEYLIENGAAEVKEYPNPQSEFFTKGISLTMDAEICQSIIAERDNFVRLLLYLYDRNMVISEQSVRMVDPGDALGSQLVVFDHGNRERSQPRAGATGAVQPVPHPSHGVAGRGRAAGRSPRVVRATVMRSIYPSLKRKPSERSLVKPPLLLEPQRVTAPAAGSASAYNACRCDETLSCAGEQIDSR